MTKKDSMRKRLSALAAAAACLMAVGVAPAANAWYNSGERNDSYMTGLWKYNWTHSYATCRAGRAQCTAEAIQDVTTVDRKIAAARGSVVTAEAYGIERNAHDSARLY
ncbi:hypothetical protein [Bifidobacterium leontopitheci]|uniref:Lactococcin 972 family bacteriocin n=1 Tax=Bifidobacterium leontopitheci TaxID=2650774 RepID=A0A6I1GKU1_9BIFI|nr:hypothetical protein [Bifidobacterium leontopitheci]KAB7790256.1 hypothetical protein F7D09_1249 [Bifidobacterium leontopitheci]